MRQSEWMIVITPEDDGFHWEVSEGSDSLFTVVDQGGAAVLSDAVYWANRAIDPFIDEDLR